MMQRAFALVLLIGLTACAGVGLVKDAQSPEERFFAISATFNEYDAAALAVASKPETPAAVVAGLKTTRNAAKEALELAAIAFDTYLEAKMQLEMAPTDPTLGDKVVAALAALNPQLDAALARVDALVAIVEGS